MSRYSQRVSRPYRRSLLRWCIWLDCLSSFRLLSPNPLLNHFNFQVWVYSDNKEREHSDVLSKDRSDSTAIQRWCIERVCNMRGLPRTMVWYMGCGVLYDAIWCGVYAVLRYGTWYMRHCTSNGVAYVMWGMVHQMVRRSPQLRLLLRRGRFPRADGSARGQNIYSKTC